MSFPHGSDAINDSAPLQLELTAGDEVFVDDLSELGTWDLHSGTSTPIPSSPSVSARSESQSSSSAQKLGSKFSKMFELRVPKHQQSGEPLKDGKGKVKKEAACRVCSKTFAWHGSQTTATSHFKNSHPMKYNALFASTGQSHLPILASRFPPERKPFVSKTIYKEI